MLTMKKAKRTAIGVDIGETAIRGVQLRRVGRGYTIDAMSRIERLRSADAATNPLDAELRRLVDCGCFKGSMVTCALNPPEVEFHVLDVPQAALHGGANADQIIHWEIGRLSSMSADRVETRHWMLPSRPGGTANAIGVSATREAVEKVLSVCGRAGLACTCVDTSATALHRFGSLLRSWGPDEIWGILDLGARQSRLVLCLGGAPILIRHTGSGGSAWTERIAEVLGVSLSTAEVQKCTHGVVVTAQRDGRGDCGAHSHHEVAAMLLSALRSDLNELASEVKRSYEYVLSTYPGKRAADLVLTGCGAGMRRLPEWLAGMLGIDVRPCSSYLGDPGCRIRTSGGMPTDLESLAVAVGLAVQE